MGVTAASIKEVFAMLYHRKAKAVTYSNIEKHISIVLFNTHTSRKDYINSIVHEAEHVKNLIWEYIGYRPQSDNDEVDAYLLTYIYNKIIDVFYKHTGAAK